MHESDKIIAVNLNNGNLSNISAELEDEQQRAIADLLLENEFRPLNDDVSGPYKIHLSSQDHKLIIEIHDHQDNPHHIYLALKPFHRLMKDYSLVCDSYYKAVREASVRKIEALDMGRKGLHDEGATIFQDNLTGKIECDFKTARRLFTLIYVLYLPSLR